MIVAATLAADKGSPVDRLLDYYSSSSLPFSVKEFRVGVLDSPSTL
jgi:hypothetical protein